MLVPMLLAFYAVLGCVVEGKSSIVMTMPLIIAASFDKFLFGVFRGRDDPDRNAGGL
jgi:hypothetical protein